MHGGSEVQIPDTFHYSTSPSFIIAHHLLLWQLSSYNTSPPFIISRILLTLLPTAFYDFLNYGGIFIPHQGNHVKIIWLIWNFVHIINGIRLLIMRNFRKFAVLFLEIWRHKIRLFTREWFIAFGSLPPEFVFNDAKITFLLLKMIFLT